eukprot:gene15222-21301_t
MSNLLQFAQLQSCVDASFWSELASKKLDEFKLSEDPVPISGWLTATRYAELPGQLQFDSGAFTPSAQRKGAHRIPGMLLNLNTEDRFKSLDKKALMKQLGSEVWADICSGAAEKDPSLLSRFSLLTYGDLKQFHFQYWFAFPALKPPSPFSLISCQSLTDVYGADGASNIAAACNAWLHPSPPDTAAAAVPPPPPCWLLVPGSTGEGLDTTATAVPLSSGAPWYTPHAIYRDRSPGTVLLTTRPRGSAGTLGCAVSRTLLAWGTRHITFVDSSKVSFSNPVRQSLFEFEDCLGGGKPKAAAAADALRRIFPSVVAEGRALSVPMPGHPPPDLEELDQLVSSHDIIFLLTDTRESRWLPSLLAAAHGKLAITSALGFDALVVMRHGAPPLCTHGPPPKVDGGSHRLGCYFCNDVVAPVNSTVDRTLDQQCTVARPGLAQIAGALAVELVAALLQHPLGIYAPANPEPSAAMAALGPVPHMIRAQLSGFNQVCMVGSAFSQCTACSEVVVKAYNERGWDFILEAIQSPKYLEDLTGLTALLSQTLASFDEEDAEGGDESATKEGGDEEKDWTAL